MTETGYFRGMRESNVPRVVSDNKVFWNLENEKSNFIFIAYTENAILHLELVKSVLFLLEKNFRKGSRRNLRKLK